MNGEPLNIGITCYPTSGGSGVVATELGRHLARRGHQVHFIAYDVPFRLDLCWRNVSFHPVEVPQYPLFEHPPYTLALANQLAQVAEDQRLDIWHVHYAIPHAASAYLAAQMLGPDGPKLVTTLHGTDITLVGRHPSFARVVAFSIEQSDAVTAVSDALRRETYDTFAVNKHIRVIHNFIDSRLFHRRTDEALRSRLAAPGERVVMHISNFREAKNPVGVVDVFAQIARRVPARLVLVGTGPEVDRVRHRARELGVQKRVRFMGEHADVAALLSAADLFLLPSRHESFGLAALEAMACGVPVIASSIGGLPELLGPVCRRCLYDPDDLDAMARAGVDILSDAGLHRRLAEEGVKRAREEFSAERIAPMYEDVYRSVLAGAPGTPVPTGP